MSKQTTLFRFSSAKLPRLDADESTETSQTMQNIFDEMEDEDGHPSSTATSTTGMSTKKNRVRSFHQSWTLKYTWLEYDKEKNAMFCKLCLGASKTNAFTVGCSNFRTSMLERHVAHSDHQASIVAK